MRALPAVRSHFHVCVCLGCDAPEYTTAVRDSTAAVVDAEVATALAELPMAGTSNKQRRHRGDAGASKRITMPPGGITHVMFEGGPVDENPTRGMAPPLSDHARAMAEAGITAGITYNDPVRR